MRPPLLFVRTHAGLLALWRKNGLEAAAPLRPSEKQVDVKDSGLMRALNRTSRMAHRKELMSSRKKHSLRSHVQNN